MPFKPWVCYLKCRQRNLYFPLVFKTRLWGHVWFGGEKKKVTYVFVTWCCCMGNHASHAHFSTDMCPVSCLMCTHLLHHLNFLAGKFPQFSKFPFCEIIEFYFLLSSCCINCVCPFMKRIYGICSEIIR